MMGLLSNFGFKLNLRRYNKAMKFSMDADASIYEFADAEGEAEQKQFEGIDMKAIGSNWIDPPKVWRCRLTPSNPGRQFQNLIA